VRVESNIMEVARIDFSLVHPQRNCAAVLALQKLFKAYYISSGVKPNDLRITAGLDAAYYDVVAVPMFSTDAIQFYSSGGSYSRYASCVIQRFGGGGTGDAKQSSAWAG